MSKNGKAGQAHQGLHFLFHRQAHVASIETTDQTAVSRVVSGVAQACFSQRFCMVGDRCKIQWRANVQHRRLVFWRITEQAQWKRCTASEAIGLIDGGGDSERSGIVRCGGMDMQVAEKGSFFRIIVQAGLLNLGVVIKGLHRHLTPGR